MKMADGEVTAIGRNAAEAMKELNRLLAIARAVEVTRRNLRG